jgi:hypothetical protein
LAKSSKNTSIGGAVVVKSNNKNDNNNKKWKNFGLYALLGIVVITLGTTLLYKANRRSQKETSGCLQNYPQS